GTGCFDAHIFVRDGQCPGESRFSHQRTEEVDYLWAVIAAFGPFPQAFGPFTFFQVGFGPVEGFTLNRSDFSQHLEVLECVFYSVAVEMVVEVAIRGFDRMVYLLSLLDTCILFIFCTLVVVSWNLSFSFASIF